MWSEEIPINDFIYVTIRLRRDVTRRSFIF